MIDRPGIEVRVLDLFRSYPFWLKALQETTSWPGSW
jgi:hypothetical protein